MGYYKELTSGIQLDIAGSCAMYFSDIAISNYKSYRKTTRLSLSTGINIIVGRNNSGKTALLEASLKSDAKPHRTTVLEIRPG